MIVKRLSAVIFTLGLGLGLGCCSPFAGYVSSNWPHFAGGEPGDLPPRPGTPGYAAFVAHGQANRPPETPTASVPSPASAVSGPVASGPVAVPVAPGPRSAVVEQQPAPTGAKPAVPSESVIRGGLY